MARTDVTTAEQSANGFKVVRFQSEATILGSTRTDRVLNYKVYRDGKLLGEKKSLEHVNAIIADLGSGALAPHAATHAVATTNPATITAMISALHAAISATIACPDIATTDHLDAACGKFESALDNGEKLPRHVDALARRTATHARAVVADLRAMNY